MTVVQKTLLLTVRAAVMTILVLLALQLVVNWIGLRRTDVTADYFLPTYALSVAAIVLTDS